jgi:hypothetical protein
MLADERQNGIPFEQNGNQVSVKIPPIAPDPVDSVLVLDLSPGK